MILPATKYRLLLLLFGLFLISGGVYSFLTGKWFAGFPPVLDFLGALPYGSAIEATVAAALGAVAIAAALLGPRVK